MSDEQTWWGVRDRPFESTCTARFFFDGRRHGEAVERLLYLVRDGNMGFGLLTGEIGCGKTMAVQVLTERLRGLRCQTLNIAAAWADFDELLREILHGMKPGSRTRGRPARRCWDGQSRYDLIRTFRTRLEERYVRLRRQLVVFLDEAQQLPEAALIELKNLTNFCQGDRNYLTIILVGQPELSETIRDLPPVDQRIGVRYHLLPLDADEVGLYVDSRMRAAGYSGEPAFAEEAAQVLYEETGGIPREINRVCKLALDRAFSLRKKRVDADVVRALAEDVLRQHAYA